MKPEHSADDVRHRSWHCIVQQSVASGLGWCIDCLRTVPVTDDNPNVMRAMPEHSDGLEGGRGD